MILPKKPQGKTSLAIVTRVVYFSPPADLGFLPADFA